MVRAFRWALGLFLLLAALAALAALFVWHVATRSLPPLDGRFTVSGLTAPVEIVRDTVAVPHIFGETDEDSFFALGFVHAQDRLWQMTLLRRTAQGRLSELFGARTLRIDEAMRRFGLYGLAAQSVQAQDASTRAALAAYAAGVNAWLAEINRGARGRGAPEFFLFPPEIAPWQPADSLAIVKLMGVQLSSQLADEVLRARASLALAPERLADLMPVAPTGPGATLLQAAAVGPPARSEASLRARDPATAPVRRAAADALQADPLSPFPERGLASASNVWAADDARAARGAALLANDPHLELSAPAIWYLARLELEGGGVIGGTIPGVPAVLVGRNADLAWGLTSAYADDLDVFVERLDPDDPTRYATPTGSAAFREDRVVLRVRDDSPVTLTRRWTENGPVLPPELFDLATVTPPGHVTSVAWTLLSAEDASMTAALGLMRARSIDEALEAAALYRAPAQNLMLATEDEIAMVMAGALPRRAARHDTEGRIPSRGWRPENRWQGTMGAAANPLFRAPASGVLGNTNSRTTDAPFPFHVSHDWGDTQRIQRLQRLMAARAVHTRESFIEAQLDTVSTPARVLLPLVAADLWFTQQAAPAGTPERRRREALDLLADWNGEMDEYLPQPLIYSAWMRALNRRLIEDDLGTDLMRRFARPDPLFLERVFRDIDGAAAWCDVRHSSAVETCAEMASAALDDALLWLEERYGPRLEALTWGLAHQATHDHPALGQVPGLGWLVNIRQPSSGSDHTLLRGATRGSGDAPFLNVHGPAYRGIYDLADPDTSVFVISTGQSGHPFSRFYDNLSVLWRRGEYVAMSLDPTLARAASVGTIQLMPRRSP